MFCVAASEQVCARAASPYRQTSWTQQASAGPGIGNDRQNRGQPADSPHAHPAEAILVPGANEI
jgi:hypothetical protein